MLAQCKFEKLNKVPLVVISSKDCLTCDTERIVKSLKRVFPGIEPEYLFYPEKKAAKLVNKLGLRGLPAYIFNRSLESDAEFKNFRDNLELQGDYYLLSYAKGGFSYFINRKKAPGKIDLFISLFTKEAAEVLASMKELLPALHFLAVKHEDGSFNAANGQPEVEEYLRSVCVQKYYPQNFWDYNICRAKNISSTWWEDCLKEKESVEQVRICARSQEARLLLEENISLNNQLGVMFGPTYLMNNQEIFVSGSALDKKELKKIFKK